MIKIASLVFVVVILSGCSKVPDYVNEKVLHDNNGCAFTAHKNIGDTMFLRFSKKASRDTCEYSKYVGE
jgi:hypothetical protein